MDRCTGNLEIIFGKWYCPNGKNPKECTYCEYCYNNKCVDSNDVYEITEMITNNTDKFYVNCDCPNKNSHPQMFAYICPSCDVNRIGKFLSNTRSCKNCDGYTEDQVYCNGCSFLLKKCCDCGSEIKDGDSCITEVEIVINKKINDCKNMMSTVDNDDMKNCIEKNIEMFNKELEIISNIYAKKTPDETCTIIQKHQQDKWKYFMENHDKPETSN